MLTYVLHFTGYTLQICCCQSLSADSLLLPLTTCIHTYFCGKLALIYKSFDCRILFAIGRASCERRNFYANKQLTGSCKAANLDFRPQPAAVAAAEATAAWAARAANEAVTLAEQHFVAETFATFSLNAAVEIMPRPHFLLTLPPFSCVCNYFCEVSKKFVCQAQLKRSRCENHKNQTRTRIIGPIVPVSVSVSVSASSSVSVSGCIGCFDYVINLSGSNYIWSDWLTQICQPH